MRTDEITARAGPSARAHSFRASLLARALDYPYGPPAAPVHFRNGRVGPVQRRTVRAAGRLVHVEGVGYCAAILAVGSNASVSVLRRKFGALPVEIIQGPARITGYAKAHSAHISRYGAMPATLVERTGAHASLHLQLVPADRLEALDASEAVGTNYDRVWLDHRIAVPWLHGQFDGVWTYRSRHGVARRDDTPLWLGPQRPALRHAADKVGWQLDVEPFVYMMVRDAGFRLAVTDALKG